MTRCSRCGEYVSVEDSWMHDYCKPVEEEQEEEEEDDTGKPMIPPTAQLSTQVDIGYRWFWTNNQLGYDKNGKVIRTDRPRVMPKGSKNFLFGKGLTDTND